VKVPPGASGSSTTSANARVPSGGLDHSSGGETSLPSQVYSTGIALDGSNAALASEKRSSAGMARLSRAGTAPKPDLRFDVAR